MVGKSHFWESQKSRPKGPFTNPSIAFHPTILTHHRRPCGACWHKVAQTTTHTEVWCYKWTTLPTTLPKIKITNHDHQANPHCRHEKQRSTHNRKENHHHHHHPPPPDYRHRPQTAPPLNPFANDGYCPNEPWNTVASTKKKKMPKLMPSPRLINWIGSPRNICHHFNPTFETYDRNS